MIVRAAGLKARDFEVNLAHLNLFCAPNRHGKSSVADAISYGLLGYVPRLGKTEANTATLMRGSKMSVDLVLDDGRTITRTLELTEGGKLRGTVHCSWLGAGITKAEEHDAAILGLIGADSQAAAEACDIRELLRLTGPQRAARVQSLLESDVDTNQVAMQVARYTMQRLAGVADERMPENHTALRPLVPGFDQDGNHVGQYAALRAAAPTLKAKLNEVGLQGAARWANALKLDAGRGLRPAMAARDKLSVRMQELGDEAPDEMARLDARRSELERDAGAAAEKRAEIVRKRSAVVGAASALSAAQTAHTAAVDAREQYEAHGAYELAERRSALARVEAETAVVSLPDPPDESEPVELEQQAAEIEQRAGSMVVPVVPSAAAEEARVAELERQILAAAGSPWARVAGIADEITELATKGARGRTTFQHDLAVQTHELRTLALAFGGESAETLANRAAVARDELAARRDEVDVAEAEATKMVARQQLLRHEASALRARATKARGVLRREYDESVAAMRDLANERRRDVEAIRNSVAALERQDRNTAEQLRTAVAALAAADQRVADVGTAPAEIEPTATADELRTVEAQLAALRAAATTRREFGRLVAEIDDLQAREAVCKALERGLQRVREEQVAQAGGPLLAHMRAVFEAAGFTESPYITGTELGWRTVRGESVSVGALSGAEWTIYTAALASAVLALRGAQERILVVEAAECDPGMLVALLRGLRAVGAELTHALVLTPVAPTSIADGWTLVELGAASQQEERAA